MVHPSIIGIIAVVIAFLNVSNVIAGPPDPGCCWAQKGQQYHYNTTTTYTGSTLLFRVYLQVDTNTSKSRLALIPFTSYAFPPLRVLSYDQYIICGWSHFPNI
jgi:hypothetical protein